MNELKTHDGLNGIVVMNGYILTWQPKKEEKKTESGIFLPVVEEDARENVYQIVAMANDVTGFNLGDNVLIDKFAGSTIVIGNERYSVALPEDIILKFPKK